jgi:hypothetical protein
MCLEGIALSATAIENGTPPHTQKKFCWKGVTTILNQPAKESSFTGGLYRIG